MRFVFIQQGANEIICLQPDKIQQTMDTKAYDIGLDLRFMCICFSFQIVLSSTKDPPTYNL